WKSGRRKPHRRHRSSITSLFLAPHCTHRTVLLAMASSPAGPLSGIGTYAPRVESGDDEDLGVGLWRTQCRERFRHAVNTDRAGEKSAAMTGSIAMRFSAAITARPTGPQPSTTAASPLAIADLFTACTPTAIGSVSAATSAGRPLGTFTAMTSLSTSSSA